MQNRVQISRVRSEKEHGNNIFWSEIGSENRAAHPHPKFWGFWELKVGFEFSLLFLCNNFIMHAHLPSPMGDQSEMTLYLNMPIPWSQRFSFVMKREERREKR